MGSVSVCIDTCFCAAICFALLCRLIDTMITPSFTSNMWLQIHQTCPGGLRNRVELVYLLELFAVGVNVRAFSGPPLQLTARPNASASAPGEYKAAPVRCSDGAMLTRRNESSVGS